MQYGYFDLKNKEYVIDRPDTPAPWVNYLGSPEYLSLIHISTHITSDLEKVADYVTFLHAGKLLLSKPKDELLWQYGILRCGEALFQKLESPEVLAWRKKDYSYDVLVPDREAILRKYPEAVIDQVTMDAVSYTHLDVYKRQVLADLIACSFVFV